MDQGKSDESALVAAICPTFPRSDLHLTLRRIQSAIDRATVRPKTINNHLTLLRTILRAARDWRVVTEILRIKLMRTPQSDVIFLDFDDAQTLVDVSAPPWRSMIVLALNTGLRIGELLALQWQDVSLDGSSIRVTRSDWRGQVGTPKSGCARSIPLNNRARGALTDVGGERKGLIFYDNAGKAYTYRKANYALGYVIKACGSKITGWHALRHTFASHLVMRGVSLTAVQRLLGHSTQAMTERYAHLTPQIGQSAVATLDA